VVFAPVARFLVTGGLAEPLRLENSTRIVPGDRVTNLVLRRVHGIAQMRETHTR
jgi:hypothetical protein